MTSCELFLNHKFYLQHPVFIRAFDCHRDKISTSLQNILFMSVSFDTADSSTSPGNLIKMKRSGILMTKNGQASCACLVFLL